MAGGGTSTYYFTAYDALEFKWTTSAQSISGGTTHVTWSVSLVSTTHGAIESSTSKKCVVTIGSRSQTQQVSIAIGNNTRKTLMVGNYGPIYHNDEGEANPVRVTVTLSADITFSGEYIGDVVVPGSIQVDPLFQPSTLTVSNGTLGTAQTLTVQRHSDIFTHKVLYKSGSASGYVAGSASATSSATSINWTPPLSLASQVTDGLEVPITFTVDTYKDSTKVGSKSVTKYFAIPESVKPSCTFTLEDITGIDDIYGSPVQNLSKIKIVVSPTLAYGSPIVAAQISANGGKYNDLEATTDVLVESGASPVSAWVRDGRGRVGSTSYTMNVQAYNRPSISALSVHRCDADGTESEQGEYIQATFSAAISSMGGKNTAAYKLRYKKSSAETFTEVTLSSLANTFTVNNFSYIFAATSDSSFDIEVTATDRHSTTTRATSASTAFTIMNWHASGTGVAFGKVAERPNSIEFGLRMYDEYNTLMGNGVAAYGGSAAPIDADTTQEHLCLTTVGTPTSDFWYVITMFYSNKTGNRAQIAVPYSKRLPVHRRYKYGGADWTEWATDSGVVLWADYWHMIDTHTITLPSPISAQPSGIVLTFSPYSEAPLNSNFQHFFVDKNFVAAHPGAGSEFNMFRYPFGVAGSKYLYISDTTIKGHANNTAVGTGASGIKYDNSQWVLRRVTGV